jgi:hypothetical protein
MSHQWISLIVDGGLLANNNRNDTRRVIFFAIFGQ